MAKNHLEGGTAFTHYCTATSSRETSNSKMMNPHTKYLIVYTLASCNTLPMAHKSAKGQLEQTVILLINFFMKTKVFIVIKF